MSELSVQILSPAKIVTKATAKQVIAPGTKGYLGVLPGHAALIAELGLGELTVEETGTAKQIYFITGGYINVADDHVTVLVDVIEKAADIDVVRAEKAKVRAQERLAQRAEDIDVARAQAALTRSLERIAVASRYKS